ncbi:MAG: outer membrane beta-barrel protein [Prevotellaceae bacterium]|nr:outer membrane beta-barrel protein [Prevotellaceae bacterium]
MRHLFILLLLFTATITEAQETPRLNIRGTVYDNQTLDPLEGAQVRLTNDEGKLISGNVTQKNGQFLLPGIPSGDYTLSVTFMGYKEQQFVVKLPKKSGNFKVSDVMMKEDTQLMAEATVTGKLPEMVVVDDTVMYNADAFKLPDGALVEELIKKLPGIVVDDDGNYTWNGKSITQILVDGKEFFGTDMDIVLKNLPAEIVDKVKAYDKQSDMARITGIDDGEEKTVLDLQIKKDRKRGWFGNLDGSYGTHERYSGRAMINRFKGDQKFSVVGNGNNTNGDGMTDRQTVGATMNWENSKVELNGSLNGQFSQGGSERWSNSQSFENQTAAYNNSWNKNHSNSNSFSFNYKVEWKPDETWNILFRPQFSYRDSRSSSSSESAAFSDDPYLLSSDPLSDYSLLSDTIGVNHKRNANHSTSDNIDASASLQVNKRLAKAGRNVTLNLNGGYSHSTSESESYSQIDYYQLLALNGEDSLYHKVQYNDAPQKNKNISAQLSYSEPVGYNIYLQFSYQYSYRFSDRDRDVSSIFDWMDQTQPFLLYGIDHSNYRQWNALASPDIDQCNYTTNTYQNHNFRLQLRVNRTLYQLTVGANIQPQINTVDYTKGLKHYEVRQSVVNASPTLNFRYKFSRQEQLDIRYNGSTGQPSITDLIPDTLSNADPLNIQLGNPYLKPSFTQQLQANYRRSVVDKQRTSALNLQFRTTSNSTTNRTEYDDLTGGRITKPVNVNGNWNGSASFNFNTALGEKQNWRINTQTQGSATNSVGYVYRSQTSETVKNRTTGLNASERLRITYRRDWDSGYQLEANATGSGQYNHSRSTNSSASNLDTYRFSYGASLNLTLPFGMTLASDITEQSRRGYSDASMNTNELIWNATLSQRFLKGKRLTVSIRATDILNRRDDVNRNVSATARTDSRSETVNSYWMLALTYRFGKFGQGGRGERRGERPDMDGMGGRMDGEGGPGQGGGGGRGGFGGDRGGGGGFGGGGRM